MKTVKILAFSLALFMASSGFASSIHWQTNYTAAKEQAEKESKPMLLLFTGSDWCGWCKKLENEVFDKPEFQNQMGGKLIFVMLDFPMAAKQSPQLKSQNEELKNKYNVTGFPTVVVINPQGKVLGTTGYKAGGPKAYADHLLQIIGK